MTAELRQKSKRGMTRYRANPYWDPTEIRVGQTRVTVAGGRHVSEDGETVEHSGIHVIRDVDRDEFIKLYTKNARAIFELKPSTQKILQYLLHQMQKTPGVDGIYLHWFDAEIYFSELDMKVSRASFMRGVKELIEKKFLAESMSPGLFWINPHLFFNGDRMRFIREYRIKKAEESIEQTRDRDTVDWVNEKPDKDKEDKA